MRILATASAATLLICACASTPKRQPDQAEIQQQRDEQATKRFNDCMDETLPKFVIFHVATADQRIKAAEVCRSVMSPAEPAKP
jgi:hypothetical protein